MSNLTNLPNELLLIVFSYLDTVDLFRAFDNLNQRFDELVYTSVQHVLLPNEINNDWIQQYLPNLEKRIKVLCIHEQSLRNIFTNKWSFSSLRLINIQGSDWNLSLRIKNEKSILFILMSSLHFLCNLGVHINTLSNFTRNCIIQNQTEFNKILSHEFIECLSMDIHLIQSLVLIRNRLPNLLHLKINYIHSEWYEGSWMNESILTEKSTRLISLNIKAKLLISFDLLKQFINSYKTSIEKLIVRVFCLSPIDGYHLESIFKPCEQLKKLVFFFRNTNVEIENCLYSFQSLWWLDEHRPAVYIQLDDNQGDTIIASIPFDYSFMFKNGLYNWNINKGDRKSSFIRFNNDKIHFNNKIHQRINLEYLYSIQRIFTSSNQCLSFDYCYLETEDLLFDLFLDGMKPILFNVKHFIVGQHALDSLMLCVWILLMPNLQQLDISKLTTFNHKELACGLKDKIDKNQCLQTNFDHINQLIVLSNDHNIDKKTKDKLFADLQTIFPNALIQ